MQIPAGKTKAAEEALSSKYEALKDKKKSSKEEKAFVRMATIAEEVRAIALEKAAEALNVAREVANRSSSQRLSLNINGAPFDLTSAIDHAFVVKSASEVAMEKAFDANVLPVLASTQNENARQESLISGTTGTQAEQNQAVNEAYKLVFPLSPEQRMAGFKEKIADLTEPQQRMALESVRPFAEKYNLDLSSNFKLQETPQL